MSSMRALCPMSIVQLVIDRLRVTAMGCCQLIAVRRAKQWTIVAVGMAVLVGLISARWAEADEPQARSLRWWKGNLHTHTLWSDGDDFPEMVAAWYADQGYNFLALSDHNILSRGPKWMPLATIIARSHEDALSRYQRRFGQEWVELKSSATDADCQVRLKPLDEFRHMVEVADKFLMMEGEEISDSAQGKPVHMNATNLSALIQPVGGPTVQATIQNNLRLVLEHEKATGRQVLPHLNHPNFGYGVTAADLAQTIEERFFEVYNGHPGVNQLGDEQHPSIESMWDTINAMRLVHLAAEPIFGLATDDSHNYHKPGGASPGRGWVMVRSRYLTPEHLIRAMKAGDFYASSGVVLDDIQFDPQARVLKLLIAQQPDATYETQFIVLPRGSSESASETTTAALPTAVVAAKITGLQPTFTLPDDVYYVRAIVTSSLDHANPSLAKQKQQAWTQPVGWSTPAQ